MGCIFLGKEEEKQKQVEEFDLTSLTVPTTSLFRVTKGKKELQNGTDATNRFLVSTLQRIQAPCCHESTRAQSIRSLNRFREEAKGREIVALKIEWEFDLIASVASPSFRKVGSSKARSFRRRHYTRASVVSIVSSFNQRFFPLFFSLHHHEKK